VQRDAAGRALAEAVHVLVAVDAVAGVQAHGVETCREFREERKKRQIVFSFSFYFETQKNRNVGFGCVILRRGKHLVEPCCFVNKGGVK
jgi:hypothetical protein